MSSLDSVWFSPRCIAPVPDRVIVRRLKEYDPHLSVHWLHREKRWVIMGRDQRVDGKRVHIMTVQNDDGSYRPLDDRVLVGIMLADSLRYDDINHFAKLIAEKNMAIDRRQQKEMHEAFRSRNEDLYRSFFGSPTVAPRGGWRIN